MFDQTFVQDGRKTRKPLTIAGSFVLQGLTIAVGILVPLVYTETLPSAQLKGLLVGPPPPATTKPAVATKVRATAPHVFAFTRLVAPKQIPQGVKKFDAMQAPPDIGVPGGMGPPDGVNNALLIMTPNVPMPPAPAETAKSKASTGALRIGGVVAEANLVHTVQPVYPPLAKIARVQGIVEFMAVISKDGRVENLQLIHGPPLLVNAARSAILQWIYRPTLLNGQPVEVLTTITVNFTLER